MTMDTDYMEDINFKSSPTIKDEKNWKEMKQKMKLLNYFISKKVGD